MDFGTGPATCARGPGRVRTATAQAAVIRVLRNLTVVTADQAYRQQHQYIRQGSQFVTGIDELDFHLLHGLVPPVRRDKLGEEQGFVQDQHSPGENESSEEKAARLTHYFKNEKDVSWMLEGFDHYWELREFGVQDSGASVVDNLGHALTPGCNARYARLRLGDRLFELNSYIIEHRSRRIEPETLPHLRFKVEDAATDYSSHLDHLKKAMAANAHLRGSEAAQSLTEHLRRFDQALNHERERIPARWTEAVVSMHNEALSRD